MVPVVHSTWLLHTAYLLMLEPWGTKFTDAGLRYVGGGFPPPEGSMNTKFSCPKDFSAICLSSPFPQWEQQDPSMVINIQICLYKISFTLYRAYLEKDTKSLRRHAWFGYCYQYWLVHFWQGKEFTSIKWFIFAKAKNKTTVKYQSSYSPVCANLALQGNFRHMFVSSQTHSHYSTAVLVPFHNPHGSLRGTESIQ